MASSELHPALAAFVEQRRDELAGIGPARRTLLDPIAAWIAERLAAGEPCRLIFVCTHNSRRSHLAHLWAAVGARVHGLAIETFSGGTEATAFNRSAVGALRRAGFEIERTDEDDNPVYRVRLGPGAEPIGCFSKVYTHPANPGDGFAAVMVCDSADAACPHVPGASGRFGLPFDDPKAADGRPDEADVYDARCVEIGREMLYLMAAAAARRGA